MEVDAPKESPVEGTREIRDCRRGGKRSCLGLYCPSHGCSSEIFRRSKAGSAAVSTSLSVGRTLRSRSLSSVLIGTSGSALSISL